MNKIAFFLNLLWNIIFFVCTFQGLIDCPAKFLYSEFKDNIVRLPEWNPTILKTELIKVSDFYLINYLKKNLLKNSLFSNLIKSFFKSKKYILYF